MPVISFNGPDSIEQSCKKISQLIDRLRNNRKSIQVFVPCDIDSICAYLLFLAICDSKNCRNLLSVYPAVDSVMVEEFLSTYADEDECPHLLVFINCFGALNIAATLEQSTIFQYKNEGTSSMIKVLCFDSHRPYLWDNLVSDDIFLVDDDPNPTYSLSHLYAQHESLQTMSTRNRGFYDEEGVWVADEDNMEIDHMGIPEIEPNSKRRKVDLSGNQQDSLNNELPIPESYHMYAYRASPVTLTMFRLVQYLQISCNRKFWLAAIALTSFREFNFWPDEIYNLVAKELYQKEYLTNNVGVPNSSLGCNFPVKLKEEIDSRDVNNLTNSNENENTKWIYYEEDLCCILYRHWNLMESFKHTALVYGRMQLHESKGIGKVRQFFTESGLVPQEYTTSYPHLDEYRRFELKKKFKTQSKRHNLTDSTGSGSNTCPSGLIFKGFVRRFAANNGHCTSDKGMRELSASDCVYICQALLDSGVSTGIRDLTSSEEGQKDSKTTKGHAETNPEFNIHEKVASIETKNLINNWYKAYEMLTFRKNSAELLESGLEKALAMQKSIVSIAKTMLRHSQNVKGIFRYVALNIDERDLLRRPPILQRLANFILNVKYKFALRKSHTAVPLLLIAKDALKSTRMCTGVIPFHEKTDRDIFKAKFEQANAVTGGDGVNNDFWDGNVIEIDLKRWPDFFSVLKGDKTS